MNVPTKPVRDLILTTACGLTILTASPAAASGMSKSKAIIEKTIENYVADINKGDVKGIVTACASRTSIVDGFPPYAWQTCADWWKGYESNNKAIGATLGSLSIGKPIYTEEAGDHAYLIYPATFTDTQEGKQVVYRGIGTMTLKRTTHGWVFTGSAWAWGANSLLAKGAADGGS
jgi:ketosteroid isomerase-like protein